MDLSRRNLLRSAAALGAGTAAGAASTTVGASPGLAAEAVAGLASTRPATLGSVLVRGRASRTGWRKVVRKDGEKHVVRTDLGARAKDGRARRRKPILAFAQLSDVHVLDAQSPMRFETAEGVSSSAYRPQETLTGHVAEAMVRELNKLGSGPVTGKPLALALQTGDNSDNSQYNEIRWNIDILDGQEVRIDSGDLSRYEGVMDQDPTYYDAMFWHPDGTPPGKKKDVYRRLHGFPTVPGLLDACRQPFQATGLAFPWYVALGNHDELVQGNFVHTTSNEAQAVGDTKPTTKGTRTVTADPDRRLLSRLETVQEHFNSPATPGPVGHGFTQANVDNATAYYTFDQGLVRFVVLDTVRAGGGADGEVDATQLTWLEDTLAATTDRLVVVASHHTSWTMQDPANAAAVVSTLLAHRNVIAWVNGHTHRNAVAPRKRDGGGGFWEINTASHIDWPQQSRLIEVVDNKDKTVSIFCTLVDHGAPLNKTGIGTTMQLAGLSRQLGANDPQEQDNDRRGPRKARNVELLVRAPAFMVV